MTEEETEKKKEIRNRVLAKFIVLDDLLIGEDPLVREGALAIINSQYPRQIRPLAQAGVVPPANKNG